MKLSDIRQRYRDRFATQPFTGDDTALDRFIAAAVQFYSRYNPVVKSTTITTVSAQQDYDLPSDCVLVVDAMYWPIGELGQQLRVGSELAFLLREPGKIRVHQPSSAIIDDIEYIQYIERTQGKWEQINKQLRLWPEPVEGGTEVDVEYTAEHALSDSIYATIPDEDLARLRRGPAARYKTLCAGERADSC